MEDAQWFDSTHTQMLQGYQTGSSSSAASTTPSAIGPSTSAPASASSLYPSQGLAGSGSDLAESTLDPITSQSGQDRKPTGLQAADRGAPADDLVRAASISAHRLARSPPPPPPEQEVRQRRHDAGALAASPRQHHLGGGLLIRALEPCPIAVAHLHAADGSIAFRCLGQVVDLMLAAYGAKYIPDAVIDPALLWEDLVRGHDGGGGLKQQQPPPPMNPFCGLYW